MPPCHLGTKLILIKVWKSMNTQHVYNLNWTHTSYSQPTYILLSVAIGHYFLVVYVYAHVCILISKWLPAGNETGTFLYASMARALSRIPAIPRSVLAYSSPEHILFWSLVESRMKCWVHTCIFHSLIYIAWSKSYAWLYWSAPYYCVVTDERWIHINWSIYISQYVYSWLNRLFVCMPCHLECML